MLYPRWLETVSRFGDRPAVMDGDQVVSFRALAAMVEEASRDDSSYVVARTGSIGFFVDVLRAWRDGQAVIPVERDAVTPELNVELNSKCRLVKHTPGASGVPRGIFFTAEQIIADGDRLARVMEMRPDSPILGVISMAHSYGFSSVLLPMILHGVPLVLAPIPFPRVVETMLHAYPGMVVPAVPPMWRAWHRSGILANAAIRLAISAGSPLPIALEREVFAAANLKIHNFYGASECGGIAFDGSEIPRSDESELGRVLPGVEVEVLENQRLRVRSDAVAMGYELLREGDELGSGAYLTHDFGKQSSEGRLYLTGNCSGAINVAGRKVSPTKVEAVLVQTGLACTARVSGIPSSDAERHEEILVEVELAEGVLLSELRSAAAVALQPWEMPRHWRERGR